MPFPVYLESIGVSGEQVAPSKLTDLTVSIPTPKGWSPYKNPNYTPGTVAIAKNNGYPIAILMVFKLTGDFDAAETVKHAKDDAEIFENFKRLDASDNNFHGFPSAMIEGSYDVNNQRLHSYNRNVIATGAALPKAAGQATPPAPQRYLVTLTVTTLAREAVAVAPGVEQIISGFTVAAK